MLYTCSTNHDTLLEAWYHQLRVSGDLDRLYLKDQRHLSFFLRSFQKPVELVFEIDSTPQIIHAMWFDPSPALGAWIGLWVHPNHRHTQAMLDFVMETYRQAFQVWPVLYALTRDLHLLAPFRHFGYTIAAAFQAEAQATWMLTLTRADFERSTIYERHQRHRRQHRQQHPRAVERAVGQ